jgi:hypothetical protein
MPGTNTKAACYLDSRKIQTDVNNSQFLCELGALARHPLGLSRFASEHLLDDVLGSENLASDP